MPIVRLSCPVLAALERKGHERACSYGVPPCRVSFDRGPRARRGSGVVLADRQGLRGVLHSAPVLPLPGAGEAWRETQQWSTRRNLFEGVVDYSSTIGAGGGLFHCCISGFRGAAPPSLFRDAFDAFLSLRTRLF